MTYVCSAEGFPIPPAIPSIWLSSHDASDPANGIHCEPISDIKAAKWAWWGIRLIRRATGGRVPVE